MKEQAENDTALKNQAKDRAKILLEQYVKSVGVAMGRDYTVRFVDAE